MARPLYFWLDGQDHEGATQEGDLLLEIPRRHAGLFPGGGEGDEACVVALPVLPACFATLSCAAAHSAAQLRTELRTRKIVHQTFSCAPVRQYDFSGIFRVRTSLLALPPSVRSVCRSICGGFLPACSAAICTFLVRSVRSCESACHRTQDN